MLKLIKKNIKNSTTSNSKYFTTTKKGEIYEYISDLNSDNEYKKKEAIKRIIANMTVGKDVSVLFPDVLKCMQTDNLELKKLVYLYLINYCKSHSELSILAVNSFQKDCSDHSPLIRSLAVRTIGCLRVEKITEYLLGPLKDCLRDNDPYVRKTAAICVVKLYDIQPALVLQYGFIDILRDLLGDSNPMVVSNSVAALSEINATCQEDVILLNSGTLNKLLLALNDCTEWGQIFILDCLSSIIPKNPQEAELICERVLAQLQHINPAVVLSAVKLLLKYTEYIKNSDTILSIEKKLCPPLVLYFFKTTFIKQSKITLLQTEPEIQFVILKSVNLVIQKCPNLLKRYFRSFYVKYNDPIYIKLEKLEILVLLADEANMSTLLLEFKEYCKEVDLDFTKKTIRAIGRCAIKLENSSKNCIETLFDLSTSRANYVVQEVIITLKDVFRKYPKSFESKIEQLSECYERMNDSEAKASMIWIIGEYSALLTNSVPLLDYFLETFLEETLQVQLQLLTAILKLFLQKPKSSEHLLQKVLSLSSYYCFLFSFKKDFSTTLCDNPNLRDRGFIYWRLLSFDPELAKKILLKEKPLIVEPIESVDSTFLSSFITEIGTLSSLFFQPFNHSKQSFDSSDDLSTMKCSIPFTSVSISKDEQFNLNSLMGDLIQLDSPNEVSSDFKNPNNVFDFLVDSQKTESLILSNESTVETLFSSTTETWLPLQNGMNVSGSFNRTSTSLTVSMIVQNTTNQILENVQVQLEQNEFGFNENFILKIQPNSFSEKNVFLHFFVVIHSKAQIPLIFSNSINQSKTSKLEFTIKSVIGVQNFLVKFPPKWIFVEELSISIVEFQKSWNRSINEIVLNLFVLKTMSELEKCLNESNIQTINNDKNSIFAYLTLFSQPDKVLLKFSKNLLDLQVVLRSSSSILLIQRLLINISIETYLNGISQLVKSLIE